jgi:Mor family transcriptional regulator
MFNRNGIFQGLVFFDEADAGGVNPTEESIASEVEIKEPIIPKGSGLEAALADYLPQDNDEVKSEDFVIEGIDENKAALIKTELEKDNPSIDNLDGFSEDELKLIKDKKLFEASESVKPEEHTNTKLEDLDKEALINEVKKNQRLVSERDEQLKETKSIEVSEGTLSQKDLEEFVEGVRTDLSGTWNRFAEKLELPSLDVVNRVALKGSVEDRLLQWQETELKNKIEKEFKLEKGEFEVVREDLFTPKTPSYRWRVETERKEKGLQTEVADYAKSQADTLKANQEQQLKDVKWYADTYYDGNEDEVLKLVEEVNAIPLKIKNGELPETAHPFNVRNLLIAANHETLVKQEVAKAVEALAKQYNDRGMYLPAQKEVPINMLSDNGTPPEDNTRVNTNKFSPMLESINSSINR